jgi:hypothetical protein
MMAGSLLGGALVEIAIPLPFLSAALINVVAILLAASFFRSRASCHLTPERCPTE